MFLCVCLSAFAAILVWREPSTPRFVRDSMLLGVAMEAGFIIWGVASGIGLLRLREWARISVLIYSAFLLLVSIPGLIAMFVMRFAVPPNGGDPELFRQMLLATRIFMAVLYGLLILTATWWLYFFNTRSARDQFKSSQAQTLPNITSAPGIVATEARRQFRARPTSISIIAWYLVITGSLFPLFLAFHVPVMLLWFLLKGHTASAAMISMGLLQVVIGIAMLKLRGWSRILAIYYFAFVGLNSLTMVLVPRARANYQQVTDEVQSRFEVSTTNSGAALVGVHVPLWTGLMFSLPLQGVILWFLIRNKPAFAPQQNTHTASLSG